MPSQLSSKNRFAMYHDPLFSSWSAYTANPGNRQLWTPTFDQHHITVAFENHVHSFKRTHKIYQGNVVPDEAPHGTVYLGDGNLGIDLPRPPVVIPADTKYFARLGMTVLSVLSICISLACSPLHTKSLLVCRCQQHAHASTSHWLYWKRLRLCDHS